MTVRDTFVAIADGDQLDDGYFNGNYYGRGHIKQVYTGTGFDTTQSDAGTDTDDYELTAINATNLAGANYVVIDIMVYCSGRSYDGEGAGYCTLKIESKEVGGVYSDSMTAAIIWYVSTGPQTETGIVNGMQQIRWVHTLTAGEKANGVQFKITSTSVCGANSAEASCANKQTVVTTL